MRASGASGSGRRAAILRLEEFAALRVSGEDRRDFLQGQLSQDMNRITPAEGAPAAWCNRQGRVLCFMAAVEWNNATFLILPAGMAETCAAGLSRYVLRSRVRIEPSGTPVFGCADAHALFARTETSASDPRRKQDDAPVPDEAWACAAGRGYCAVRLPGERTRALLLGAPPDLSDAAGDLGWTAERWRLADIEAEIPWIGQSTSGQFLAHSLNLDRSGAVSFTKGCYVGQEIIARMEYRGVPKRRMQRIRLPLETAAKPGARLRHSRLGAVAIICAAADGQRLQALAEVRLASDRTSHEEQP